MSLTELLRSIDFELIEPGTVRGRDWRFTVTRADGSSATIVELPGAPVDAINATLGPRSPSVRRLLRPVCDVPRLSTYAVGAVLNEAVRRMRSSEAYVNVGTWHGFSLLAGMAGNPERTCIGIDNFSKIGGPRAAFMAIFEQRQEAAHRFFEMDYRDYFASEHRGPIGLYCYDGDHAYEHQLEGLRIAEPFFSDGCIVVVDDTNWPDPRRATLDFVAQSKRGYRTLLDVRTPDASHPTFWNGLMVLQATGSSSREERVGGDQPRAPEPAEDAGMPSNPIDFGSKSTLVSVVVCNYEPDAAALQAVIEAVLAQSWPQVEILVADASGDDSVSETIRGFGDRIVDVRRDGRGAGPRDGLEASRGPLVAFVDSRASLERSAIEIGLALPDLSRYHLGLVDDHRRNQFALYLAAAEAINSTIPANEQFVLVGRRNAIPATIDRDRAMPLWGPPVPPREMKEPHVIARFEELRRAGAAFVVFMPRTARWLDKRPAVRDYLARSGRAVLENDAVRVFELDRG